MKKDKTNTRDKRVDKKISVNKKINRGTLTFLMLLVFLFIALIIRLLYIQVVQSEELTISALNQLTRTETINSNRGVIYDRNNKELAINVTKSNVFYNLDVLTKKSEESDEDFQNRKNKLFEEDAKIISSILEIDEDELREKMNGKKIIRVGTNVDRTLAQELLSKRKEFIDEKKKNLYGLSSEDVTRRYYPFNNLASHVIGFTNDENVGQYGIEASFDEELSGISGKNISIKDNAHRKIPLTDEKTYAAKEGYSVVLSLDSNIEQFAESAAEKALKETSADSVSVIVQDTKNSQILAMTTKGDYNLNDPKAPTNEKEEKEWDNLDYKEKQNIWYDNWRNFNVNDQIEPGSTFKLITAASALEQATTNPDKHYTCTGVLSDIKGMKIRCTAPPGDKTFAKAIEESCNITLVKVGRELGKENFLKYINAFGFGKKTGIELNGEATGMIPRTSDEIGPVRLSTMSYGHGIAVTPIQLINAVSAIANGGFLNTPSLIKEIRDVNGNVIKKENPELKRRVISENTSNTMKNLMERVVTNGTGKKAQVPGYRVGGKTGTAYIPSKNGGYEDAFMSSFVGVAPLNDPKITVLVILNNPKGVALGGAVAAPVAGEVMKNTLNYLNIPRTEEVKKSDEEEFAEVPNVRGLLVEDAGKILLDRGFKFNINSKRVPNGSVVVEQNPSQGAYVNLDKIIDLVIDGNTSDKITMPDLSKKTRKESIAILKTLNLEYNIKGDGNFYTQSPKAGEKITRNGIVELVYEQVKGNLNTKESTNNSNLVKNAEVNENSTKNKNNNYEK